MSEPRQLDYTAVMDLYAQGGIDAVERAQRRGQLDELRARARSARASDPPAGESGGAT